MQIVLFIVDNSASMGQRCYLGTRILDVAKGAVETFIKMRSRDPGSRNDRYMLVTLDEPMYSIKAGWKETHAILIDRLKSLSADGLTTLGQALRTSFDLLSVNRLISGIDTYGQGRSPFFLEPAMIVAVTDGGKLSNKNGVQSELHLPMTDPLPGSELTKEPFRWDQRLFSLVLRLPATTTQEPEVLGSVPSDPSPISLMCEVTGGRSYSVTSQKTLMQCLESLVQKVQGGVVGHFECIDPEKRMISDPKHSLGSVNGVVQNKLVANGNGTNSRSASPNHDQVGTGWASLHRMIYVRPSPKSGIPVGHWPLPEAYWPDHNAPSLPPRTAHPILRYSCVDTEPLLLPNFPYDKYELEPSPLTQALLEKKNPNICWQVYVQSSGKYSDSASQPCGYLKASSNLSCVNLFVMPYNYPVLLPLIHKLVRQKMKPTPQWRSEFEDYLKTLPSYYIGAFRKAMRQLGVSNLVPDSFDVGLSYSVLSYFKKLKQQAKVAADRLLGSVGMVPPHVNKGVKVSARYNTLSVTQLPNFNQLLASVTENASLMPKVEMNEFPNFHIGCTATDRILGTRSFHNAFDIRRSQLLSQVRRMKINFHHALSSNQLTRIRLQDREGMHNQLLSTMGNYQDYLKKMYPPLRELDPDTPKRLHTFGNPFKLAKEKGMMVDETEDYDAPSSGNKPNKAGDGRRPNRRKRSPSPYRSGTPPVYKRNTTVPVNSALTNEDLNSLKPNNTTHLDNTASSSIPHNLMNGDSHINIVDKLDAKLHTQDSNHLCSMKAKSALQQDVFYSDSNNKHSGNAIYNNEDGGKTDITLCANNRNWKKMHRKNKTKKSQGTNASEIGSLNSSIQESVIKLIRKPGRHYSEIFEAMQKLKGSKACKLKVLRSVMKEAHRFKKSNLIQFFTKFKHVVDQSRAVLSSPVGKIER